MLQDLYELFEEQINDLSNGLNCKLCRWEDHSEGYCRKLVLIIICRQVCVCFKDELQETDCCMMHVLCLIGICRLLEVHSGSSKYTAQNN